jgi:hypothetical protein
MSAVLDPRLPVIRALGKVRNRKDYDAILDRAVNDREGKVLEKTLRVFSVAMEPASGNASARAVAASTTPVKRAPRPGSSLL